MSETEAETQEEPVARAESGAEPANGAESGSDHQAEDDERLIGWR